MATQQQSDSNPNFSKGYFDGLIRIINQVIRILGEEEEKLKVRQSDSNHQITDSNHLLAQNSNIAKVIRIT